MGLTIAPIEIRPFEVVVLVLKHLLVEPPAIGDLPSLSASPFSLSLSSL
jgi:hypothetical protein